MAHPVRPHSYIKVRYHILFGIAQSKVGRLF